MKPHGYHRLLWPPWNSVQKLISAPRGYFLLTKCWVKIWFSTTRDIEIKLIYLDRARYDGQEYHRHNLRKLILECYIGLKLLII